MMIIIWNLPRTYKIRKFKLGYVHDKYDMLMVQIVTI